MDADEFGRMRDSTGVSVVGAKYGWTGGKQRAAEPTSGLVRMGVRIYSPLLGIFLQTDPVLGGNAGPYTFVSDPIGMYDLDGRWGWKKPKWVSWRNAATLTGAVAFGACVVASFGVCAAAGAVALGVSTASRYYRYRSDRNAGRFWRGFAFDVGTGWLPGARGFQRGWGVMRSARSARSAGWHRQSQLSFGSAYFNPRYKRGTYGRASALTSAWLASFGM